jgi:hypothetical protein
MLISVEGKYQGFYYIIDWKKDRPIEAITSPKLITK